jgi:hypothetical protein
VVVAGAASLTIGKIETGPPYIEPIVTLSIQKTTDVEPVALAQHLLLN